jgi:hypothetical protein
MWKALGIGLSLLSQFTGKWYEERKRRGEERRGEERRGEERRGEERRGEERRGEERRENMPILLSFRHNITFYGQYSKRSCFCSRMLLKFTRWESLRVLRYERRKEKKEKGERERERESEKERKREREKRLKSLTFSFFFYF